MLEQSNELRDTLPRIDIEISQQDHNSPNIDNATEYSMATGFVRIAMEEFHAHKTNNMTGLVVRYWDLLDQELAGE